MHPRAKMLLEGWKKHCAVPANYFIFGADADTRRAFADMLTQHLFCPDACGKCTHCAKLAHGTHPDLFVIEKTGKSVGMEQARDLRSMIHHPPYEAPYRVVLVPETDAMTPEAVNSLLKSVEEAAKNSLFFFLAPHREGIPGTLVSRCQSIPLPDVAVDISTSLSDALPRVQNKSLGERVAYFENLASKAVPLADLHVLTKELYRQLRNGETNAVPQLRSVFSAQRRLQMHVNAPLVMTNLALDWQTA